MADLLDVLAALYLHEPSPEMIREYNEYIVPFVEQQMAGFLKPVDETEIDALKQDYHALFLVPVSGRYLSPFESAQRSHRLWGPMTHEVALIYTQTGFDINALVTDEIWRAVAMPDHIGYELAFTCLLLRHMPSEEASLKDTYRYFIQQHVLSWIPEYGERLQTLASTRFYKDVGKMTASFVRML